MSNYTKATDFAAKDALSSGDPDKIIKGTPLDDEFNAIAVASASKANTAGPTFTGTATFANIDVTVTADFGGATIADLGTVATVDLNGGTIDGTTIGGAVAAAGDFTVLTATSVDGIIGSVTPASGVFTSVSTDTISEKTGAAGVTVDGVLLKDSLVGATYLPDASTTAEGIVEIATQAEVDTGTDTVRVVTPETLTAYTGINRFNLVINGDFSINQRGGTRTPGVGVYGYDRWQGHASGLEQVVEYTGPAQSVTLSWTGGGTGSLNGTGGSSPITEDVSAQTNFSCIVPDDATLVQCERGESDTPFAYLPAGDVLRQCQRYFEKSYEPGVDPGTLTLVGVFTTRSVGVLSTIVDGTQQFAVAKRATPTMVSYSDIDATPGEFNEEGVSVSASFRHTGTVLFEQYATNAVTASKTYNMHWTAEAEL
jgi:hypothetical protein